MDNELRNQLLDIVNTKSMSIYKLTNEINEQSLSNNSPVIDKRKMARFLGDDVDDWKTVGFSHAEYELLDRYFIACDYGSLAETVMFTRPGNLMHSLVDTRVLTAIIDAKYIKPNYFTNYFDLFAAAEFLRTPYVTQSRTTIEIETILPNKNLQEKNSNVDIKKYLNELEVGSKNKHYLGESTYLCVGSPIGNKASCYFGLKLLKKKIKNVYEYNKKPLFFYFIIHEEEQEFSEKNCFIKVEGNKTLNIEGETIKFHRNRRILVVGNQVYISERNKISYALLVIGRVGNKTIVLINGSYSISSYALCKYITSGKIEVMYKKKTDFEDDRIIICVVKTTLTGEDFINKKEDIQRTLKTDLESYISVELQPRWINLVKNFHVKI